MDAAPKKPPKELPPKRIPKPHQEQGVKHTVMRYCFDLTVSSRIEHNVSSIVVVQRKSEKKTDFAQIDPQVYFRFFLMESLASTYATQAGVTTGEHVEFVWFYIGCAQVENFFRGSRHQLDEIVSKN